MSTAQQRPDDELWRGLENQLKSLSNSLWAFEAGQRWEAQRIAVAVANLVYSYRKTRGILDQLGAMEEITFWSSGFIGPDGNLIPEFPLTSGQIPSGDSFSSLSAAFGGKVPPPYVMAGFSDWWSQPVIKTGGWLNPPYANAVVASALTRKDIVMTFRDQDGGAHFDATLSSELYTQLKREGTAWSLVDAAEKKQPVTDVLEATMAQIGHEIMASVLTFYPKLSTGIGNH